MRRKRGLTLTEVLVTLMLMALVFLSGMTLTRGSLAGAQTRGAADLAAQYLRTSRDTALAEGDVVAVSFPAPLGIAAPRRLHGRIRDVLRLDRDFPDATFFAGWWSHPSATLDAPSLGFPATSLTSSDPTLLFRPDGSVTSNGWPLLNGEYQLLVTNGATWQVQSPGGTAGSATCCRLTAACRPYTVSISPLGEIRVTPGVLLSTDVAVSEQPQPRPALAAAPTVPGAPGSGPSITSITYSPDMDRLTLPAGASVLVRPEGYVGLAVRADSPEGCPLFCRWSVGSGQGAVSAVNQQRMWFDGTAWVSRWSWRPPLSLVPGLTYRLDCEVRDSYGNVAPAVANSQLEVRVNDPVRPVVAFSTDTGLYSVTADATGLRRLTWTTTSVPDRQAQFSPDGHRVLYSHGFAPPTFGELCVADADGGDVQVVATNLLSLSAACSWSPSGTRIAWMGAGNGGMGDVFIANADGSSQVNLTNSPEHESFGTPGHGTQSLPWREVGAGLEIVTTRQVGSQQHVITVNATSAAVRDLTPGLSARYPALSPDGNWLAFISGNELWKVESDASPAASALTATGGKVQGTPCFSPDNQWLYYLKEVAWDPYGGQFELRRVRVADGTGDSRITGARNMTMMQFFPGTNLAAFVCPDPPTNDNLQGMAADGSGQYLLTNFKPYKWMHGAWGGVP